MGGLLRSPFVDGFGEHREWHGAVHEHGVVESLDVETVPELSLGPLPETHDLELTHLVGESLAGHGDVSIDLLLDGEHPDRGPAAEEVDGVLAAPPQGVHTCVRDEAPGPPGVG